MASEMPVPHRGGGGGGVEKLIFNNMRYRSSETVHRMGCCKSSVSVQIMFK